jgi:hypothetical protein
MAGPVVLAIADRHNDRSDHAMGRATGTVATGQPVPLPPTH